MAAQGFCWGRPEVGGKDLLKKNSYYTSCFLGEEEYNVGECVYVCDNPDCPSIGKIMRMWETKGGEKKVRIRWFFRPSDINISAEECEEKEVFIAAGAAQGVQDTNPLDVIAGKCRLVCTSTHPENRRPSKDELRNAEYVFSRCYDVETAKVSSNLDKVVEEVTAMKLFNNRPPISQTLEKKPKKSVLAEAPRSENTSAKETHVKPALDKTISAKVPAPTQRRSLFKKFSWEEQLEYSYENGLVIRLENLDPALNTKDLQEAFKKLFPEVRCEISVIPKFQQLTSSTTGQALVCFTVKEQGREVLARLQANVLTLTKNGRPVIAHLLDMPNKKAGRFPGHLKLEEVNKYNIEKMSEAVSTAHCSQPNTIEYEMGIKWRMLHEQHKCQSELLNKLHEEEMKSLTSAKNSV